MRLSSTSRQYLVCVLGFFLLAATACAPKIKATGSTTCRVFKHWYEANNSCTLDVVTDDNGNLAIAHGEPGEPGEPEYPVHLFSGQKLTWIWLQPTGKHFEIRFDKSESQCFDNYNYSDGEASSASKGVFLNRHCGYTINPTPDRIVRKGDPHVIIVGSGTRPSPFWLVILFAGLAVGAVRFSLSRLPSRSAARVREAKGNSI